MTKYNKISLILFPMANYIGLRVGLRKPTAVIAADTVLSKRWYMLAKL